MRIPERQAQLDALAHRYLTDPAPEPNSSSHLAADSQWNLSDNEVIALCRKAKNAAKFSDLYDTADASLYGGDHRGRTWPL